MASLSEIKQSVGQLFIIGFNGYAVPPEFRDLLREYHIGGTIYFKRNVQSPAQLAELSNELQFSSRPKEAPALFISIDHEGGKVNRLVKPFTKFPGNDYLGELGSPKVGFEFGVVLGKELAAVGINVNYAPVVDVYTNRNNTVIRNRAFSDNPEVCGKLGSAVCRGIQKMGVIAVAKHFPGHGDTKEDSHMNLPSFNKSLEELEQIELIPFRRVIRSRVEGIMVGHLLNTAIDPDFPATLSEKTVNGLLREKLRYSKLVFSDDMEMKAITKHHTEGEAAVLAINAGVDCLIYRAESALPTAALEAVVKAVESKEIPMQKIEASLQRIKKAKQAYVALQKPIDVTEVGNFIGLPDHFRLADRITKKELLPSDNESEVST